MIDLFDIWTESTEAKASVEGLKKAIGELQSELLNLTTGSDEYVKVVEELNGKQTALNQVMSVGTGSAVKNLQNDVSGLKDKLAVLKEGSEEYILTLQKLADKQDELSLINQNALPIQDNMKNLNGELIGGFTAISGVVTLLGGQSDILTGAMVKLQTVFAIMSGVNGLSGMKVTITALISSFKALTTSTHAFKSALMSTGIGAVVVLIGVLLANLDKLSGLFGRNSQQAAQLAKSYESYKNGIGLLLREQEVELRILQATGATERELILARREHTGELILQTQAELNRQKNLKKMTAEEKERIKELEKSLEDYRAAWEKTYSDARVLDRKEEYDKEQEEIRKAEEAARKRQEIYKAEKEEVTKIKKDLSEAELSETDLRLKRLKEEYHKQLELLDRHNEDTIDLTVEYYRQVQNITDEQDQLIQQEKEEAAEKSLKLKQDELQKLKDAHEEELNENALQQERLEDQRLQLQLDKLEAEDPEKAQEAEDRLKEVQERLELAREEQLLLQEEFKQQYQTALDELVEQEWLTEEMRTEIRKESAELANEIELNKLKKSQETVKKSIKLKEDEAAAEKKVQEERKKLQDDYLTHTSSLFSKSVELIGKNTIAGKAIAIAGATIDTYQAGVKALNSGLPFPLNLVALATTITTGLATVKQIASTSVPGSSGGSSSVGAAAASSIAEAVSIPEAAVEEVYQPDIQQSVSYLTSTEQQSINTESRVYVLETDIRDTMSRVAVSEAESTF